ncbi:hypothetical protein ST47_g10383 [Ascochyta rabiei]|uniref:Rhodopsin domain-containing protein n=1 Tax=Didymella rabiei TaxID=5454 RepID=A0A162VHM7_DIDRA|nr:hypothetical protein ST47_g10383 [Ascochyta rabiei]
MRTATPEEEALWPSPNFENPEKLHGPIIGVTMTTFILAVVSGGLTDVDFPISVSQSRSRIARMGPEAGVAHTLCKGTQNSVSDAINGTLKHGSSTSHLTCSSQRPCRPIRAHWSSKTGSDCMNTRATIAAIATLNSFSDLMIYLRPMKPLLILQTPAKQRWGLVVLLLMSLPPCIAGLLRLYYVQAFYDSVDELWNASVVWALMMIEMNLGIVCSCFFGVQPMLALLFPRFFAGFYPSKDGSPPRTHRQGSGYPSASEAYPLSDLSTKPGEQRKNQPDKFEALWTPEGRGSNFASASSSGRTRGERLAPGVITVDMEFTVDEEISPCNSPMIEYSGKMGFLMDRLSEDWTGA